MATAKTCPMEGGCEDKTDEELVELVKKNKECYVCLMERYEDKISRYIKRISGVNEETCEDILQDVFMKVYINLNSFKPEMKFSSWLYRIAHNEVINHWRKHKRNKPGNVSIDYHELLKNIIKYEYNTEEGVYQKMINSDLRKALDRLDEKYKTVLVLNYLEGKSYQEIADILKKPIGTVGTLISRAKKKVLEELKEEGVTSSKALKD
ncbi:MAG: RNA polymerase sigma factor [Candidatus Moranbacteria bacterium]|nr:RNA polymerase sigma factor [Candidatus Moranbacteria bacterium]